MVHNCSSQSCNQQALECLHPYLRDTSVWWKNSDDDTLTLGDYGINSHGAHLHMVLKLRCSICCSVGGPFRLNADELDPIYDFDFSNLDDDVEI